MTDIIIHGASSFIGKHFCKYLIEQKRTFVVIAREKSNLQFLENAKNVSVHRYSNSINELFEVRLDVTSPIFIDCAWSGVFGSERNNPEQISANIPMSISSVKIAHHLGACHWVGFGSQAEYGNLNKSISESEECKPTTLYGKSKLLCAKITAELSKSYNMDHTWLRLFSVFGPDDNHDWLIQYLIKEMLSNKDINVTKAEQYWDYLYIADIVLMLEKLVEHKGLGIVNLGSGKATQLKFIIDKIKDLTESKSVIHYGAVPYREDQVMFMEADITKISESLIWQPKVSMEEGLRRTVNFLLNQNINAL
jgi:UDP-glucose 4-epimerase